MTEIEKFEGNKMFELLRKGSTPTSLDIPIDISFDDWEKLGNCLDFFGSGVQWWRGDWFAFGEHKFGQKYSQAVDGSDFEEGTLRNLCFVSQKVQMSLRNDNLKWSHHREVASLPPEEQKNWLDKAESEQWTVRKLREAIRNAKLFQEDNNIPAMIEGKFQTIVIEAPWKLSKIEREMKLNRFGFEYSVMNIDQLKKIPIQDKLDSEGFVYLWVTQKFMSSGFALFEKWNLKFIFMMVWHKNGGIQQPDLPQDNAEFVMVGKKGSPPFSDLMDFQTCFSADSREHSGKPDEFYNLIKRVSPGPYLQMYGLEERDEWALWPKKEISGKE